MALTTVPVELANLDGAVTVNESSADADFRVESNGSANMLFVDGGNDRVGINNNSPLVKFTVAGGAEGNPATSGTTQANASGRFFYGGASLDIGHYSSGTAWILNSSPSDLSTNRDIALQPNGGNVVIGGSTVQGGGLLTLEGADANMLVLHRTADTGDQGILFYDHGDYNATIYGKNGGALEFRTNGNSTVAMQLDSAGRVTMPSQPAFLVRPASTQTDIANATVVSFGTEIFDVGNNFASNQFTAPVTGKYQLNMNIRFDNIDRDAGYVIMRLETSNRSYDGIIEPNALDNDAAFWVLQTSVLTDMDASDTAKVIFYFSGGTAQGDVGTNSSFSGYLVA